MIGFSGVLLRDIDGELNHAQSHHTRLIHDAGKQLLDFVDEAFEAAHVLSGEVVPTPVRGVAESAELVSDGLIVRRILGALVDRAVLLTVAGEITIELAVTLKGIRIGIVDAGPMIPEAERAMLFESFGRMRTVSGLRPDASGLPLAIAAALTATLHGTIEVDSHEGGVTRLSVTLPGLATGE